MTTFVPPSMLAFSGAIGFRNKILNGCGWIDQRNSNSPVTCNSTANTFGPDRWAGSGQNADGVFTLQGTKSFWDGNGKGMPSSIYAATTTADASIGASQAYGIRYCIEGQDIAPWRIGTAQAALCTLSFRAYSSKAGTHCVSLQNSAGTRSYVATYSLPSANTWTQVSIQIQMDTTGTWLNNDGIGIRLFWNLGSGSSFFATANTWSAGQYYAVSGCQNVIDTNGAVFAITDVQLEQGSQATDFEMRPLEIELSLCQRYYETGASPYWYASSMPAGGTSAYGEVNYAVAKRAAPSSVTATGWQYFSGGAGTAFTPTISATQTDRFTFQGTGLTNWQGWAAAGTWAANAEI